MKARRRIAAPKAQGLCGPCYGMTQLQQGFAAGEMGFRVSLHDSNLEPAHVRFVPKADIKLRALSLVPAPAPMPGDTHDGHEGHKHYSESCRHDASV
jgi:hypothetical protein